MLTFLRWSPNKTFNCHNARGLKFFSQPRLILRTWFEGKYSAGKQLLSPTVEARNCDVDKLTTSGNSN